MNTIDNLPNSDDDTLRELLLQKENRIRDLETENSILRRNWLTAKDDSIMSYRRRLVVNDITFGFDSTDEIHILDDDIDEKLIDFLNLIYPEETNLIRALKIFIQQYILPQVNGHENLLKTNPVEFGLTFHEKTYRFIVVVFDRTNFVVGIKDSTAEYGLDIAEARRLAAFEIIDHHEAIYTFSTDGKLNHDFTMRGPKHVKASNFSPQIMDNFFADIFVKHPEYFDVINRDKYVWDINFDEATNKFYQIQMAAVISPSGSGNIIEFMCRGRDITEDISKEVQEEAERNLLQAFSSLYHELGNIAHEINHYPDLYTYEKYRKGKLGNYENAMAELEKIIDSLKEEYEKLTSFITTARDFNQTYSKDSDRKEIGRYSLAEVLTNLIIPEYHDNKFNLHFDKNFVFNVYFDREDLCRVLKQLINNAVMYSDDTQEIDIYITHKENSENRPVIELVIQDHGYGMHNKDLINAFNIGYRGLNRPANTYGLGIGLTIVKKIIENYGGKVFINSEPGVGTNVYVEFPIKEKVIEG
jgi:signal transduction histidine kinase